MGRAAPRRARPRLTLVATDVPMGQEKLDADDRRLLVFLDAAAAYFARIGPSSRAGGAFHEAMVSGIDPDRRLALAVCQMLARNLDPRGASAVERALFDELRTIGSKPLAPRNQDAAYAFALRLVEEYAGQLPRAAALYNVADGDPETYVAQLFIRDLAIHVDPKLHALLSADGTAVALERLRRYDPKPKGKRGKLGAASVLAQLLRMTGAFDHTMKRSEDAVTHAIEAGVRRHKNRPR